MTLFLVPAGYESQHVIATKATTDAAPVALVDDAESTLGHPRPRHRNTASEGSGAVVALVCQDRKWFHSAIEPVAMAHQ